MNKITFQELIKQATNKLEVANENANIARTLLLYFTKLNQNELYQNLDKNIDFSDKEYFNALDRFLKGEQIQYIIGEVYFYGYDFKIDSRALIPRYETELLVEKIINHSDEYFVDNQNLKIVDIGTGSGIIAIALNKEITNSSIWASDIDDDALALANENNKINDANVTFLHSDMLNYFVENKMKFDILVSNPPYISRDETKIMSNRVLDHEPDVALFGGETGLVYYENIFKNARKILNPKFMMGFEMGAFQKDAIEALLIKYNFNNYQFSKDYADKWRNLIVFNNLK